jgi:hypothetical protein
MRRRWTTVLHRVMVMRSRRRWRMHPVRGWRIGLVSVPGVGRLSRPHRVTPPSSPIHHDSGLVALHRRVAFLSGGRCRYRWLGRGRNARERVVRIGTVVVVVFGRGWTIGPTSAVSGLHFPNSDPFRIPVRVLQPMLPCFGVVLLHRACVP